MCSNRCAALLKVTKLNKALADAEKCVELRPDWDKAYFRKGSVFEAMADYQAAAQAYRQGATVVPDNRELDLRAARMESLVKQTRARQRAEQSKLNDQG